MAHELYALLAVAIVGLAAVGSLVSPTGAIVGLHCTQIMTPAGVGRLICTESGTKTSFSSGFARKEGEPNFVPSSEQMLAKFPTRDRLTAEDTSAPRYQEPSIISGGTQRMFSGEDYVNRRRLQRERENV